LFARAAETLTRHFSGNQNTILSYHGCSLLPRLSFLLFALDLQKLAFFMME
jgi:hypothetical protein